MMRLPNFLGIGEEKCGTTWLRQLLSSHPDVFLPTRGTEIHFFDRYYGRGIGWYERYFPSETQARRYQVMGEITPSYFHCTCCPERIAGMPSITKLILMVRNPVDRAYSHYWHRVRIDRFSGSFQDSLSAYPTAIQWGYYSKSLKNYLCHFEREQILALIFEEAVTNASETKQTLARFLGVSSERFPQAAGTAKINRGRIPRFPSLYTRAVYGARKLRDIGLDWVVNLARKIGIPRLFDNSASLLPPMKEEARTYLGEIYKNEIEELEVLLRSSLACWK